VLPEHERDRIGPPKGARAKDLVDFVLWQQETTMGGAS